MEKALTNEDKMAVTFTAKELFGRVDQKLDMIVASLDTKADHSDVVKLAARVEIVEDSIRATDLVAATLLAEKKTRWTKNEKILATTYAGFNIILGIAALGPDLIHRWIT